MPSTSRPALFPSRPKPRLFAHRGASAHAPENTLPAFDLACRLGAPILELDVHMARDGEVVVCHDPSVDRTTNGHGLIKEQSYADLGRLDAGARFRRHGEALFAERGIVIPRLAEVLESFPQVGLNIEIKQREPDMVGAVLALLEKAGPRDVVLAAEDDVIMKRLERAEPGCALGLSRGQVKQVLLRGLSRRSLRPFAGRALQIPIRHPAFLLGAVPLPNKHLIKEAHRHGMEIHLWTIDNPEVASEWLCRGVDGIITNDPGALLDLFPLPTR